MPVSAKTDKTTETYLKECHHISAANPFVEKIIQKAIKNSLHKELKGKYKIKFKGYTLSSMKKGIFKYLEITGFNSISEDIEIPYFNLRTITDYNWIDYNKNPIIPKSDMTLAYIIHLNENSVNTALQSEKYQKKLQKVNQKIYPFFNLNDVKIKIKNNRIFIIMDYNTPLSKKVKNKTFVVTSNFKVEHGKIKAYDIGLNKTYGNAPLEHITNLINLLDPLSFTLDLMNQGHCNGTVENVIIKKNVIEIDGKIFIKGENQEN